MGHVKQEEGLVGLWIRVLELGFGDHPGEKRRPFCPAGLEGVHKIVALTVSEGGPGIPVHHQHPYLISHLEGKEEDVIAGQAVTGKSDLPVDPTRFLGEEIKGGLSFLTGLQLQRFLVRLNPL